MLPCNYPIHHKRENRKRTFALIERFEVSYHDIFINRQLPTNNEQTNSTMTVNQNNQWKKWICHLIVGYRYRYRYGADSGHIREKKKVSWFSFFRVTNSPNSVSHNEMQKKKAFIKWKCLCVRIDFHGSLERLWSSFFTLQTFQNAETLFFIRDSLDLWLVDCSCVGYISGLISVFTCVSINIQRNIHWFFPC